MPKATKRELEARIQRLLQEAESRTRNEELRTQQIIRLDAEGRELRQECDGLKRQIADTRRAFEIVEEQAKENKQLVSLLDRQIRDNSEITIETLLMMAATAELRDGYTGYHMRCIGIGAELLALKAGVSPTESRRIGMAALPHDIGKQYIPESLLNVSRALTPEEREQVKPHTVFGQNICLRSKRSFWTLAGLIARHHHEWWNGNPEYSYPDHIEGDAIPMAARITSVIDVHDALISERVYKEAWPMDKARREIDAGKGKAFDPHLVEVFQSIPDDLLIANREEAKKEGLWELQL